MQAESGAFWTRFSETRMSEGQGDGTKEGRAGKVLLVLQPENTPHRAVRPSGLP